jgi:hypothetical protein
MNRFTKVSIALAATSVAVMAPVSALAAQHTPKPATTALTIQSTNNPTKGDHYKAGIESTLRSGNKAVAGETVSLDARKGGVKAWTPTGETATTDTNGQADFSLTQSAKTEQYRVVFAGDSSYRASHSGTVTVHRSK